MKKINCRWLSVFFFIITNAVQAAPINNLTPAWIELGVGGKIIARIITQQPQCPQVLIDQKPQPMQVRAQPGDDFEATTCEAIIPATAKTVAISGQILKLPTGDPKRIVIIGDTGCRLKFGAPTQACNNPNKWPFAKVAAHAASYKPDLIIHLGDFLYRERACPFYDPRCAGSPYGDTWQTWQADFFKPAAPLLKSAPWIMVRGNHEDCDRAGEGWFRFLAPMPYSAICIDHSPVYAIPLKDLNLFIMDSSSANDFKVEDDQVKTFIDDFTVIKQSKLKNIWLLTHKPIWWIKESGSTQSNPNTLQIAANALPNSIKLLLAGHVHRFQVLNFTDKKPPQVIVGDSGTLLSTGFVKPTFGGEKIAQATVAHGIDIDNFGYMTMEKIGNSWIAQVRNVEGNVMANCKFNNANFDCVAAEAVIDNAKNYNEEYKFDLSLNKHPEQPTR